MHAKTDSEVTSLAASSPTRSPRRPAYYVQSPSRDSHDGEKTATSFHSTPVLSPMGSPPHSHSSSSRFSKINGSKRKTHKQCAMIEEEGLLDDGDRQHSLPRRCYVLAFIVGFSLLFAFFSLILYAAAKPQKPKISVKVSFPPLLQWIWDSDKLRSSVDLFSKIENTTSFIDRWL